MKTSTSFWLDTQTATRKKKKKRNTELRGRRTRVGEMAVGIDLNFVRTNKLDKKHIHRNSYDHG